MGALLIVKGDVATQCLANLLDEMSVGNGSITGLTALPCVGPTPCHLVERTHHLDRMALPVCRDEGEHVRFRSETKPDNLF